MQIEDVDTESSVFFSTTPAETATMRAISNIVAGDIRSRAIEEYGSYSLPVYSPSFMSSWRGFHANRLDFSYTPLHIAVEEGLVPVVALLLQRTDTEVRGRYHETPLHLAAVMGYERLVTILLNANANVNAVDLGDATPLHLAAGLGLSYRFHRYAARRHSYLDTLRILVQGGADRSRVDGSGLTAHALARMLEHAVPIHYPGIDKAELSSVIESLRPD